MDESQKKRWMKKTPYTKDTYSIISFMQSARIAKMN